MELAAYHDILFPYAYNILGSAEDARDAIQDVLSAWLTLDKTGIADERNYLIRSVINRAINLKKRNARMAGRPEGWLPEPIATDDGADRNLYLKDILSYSLLVLLEKLNATERAVFILKESLDYSHQEIAEVLSITEEHSRKLLSRAKTRLFKPETAAVMKQQQTKAPVLLEQFIDAIRQRDTGRLESLLSEDIAYQADGGGKVRVVSTFTVGAVEVAALLILVHQRLLSEAMTSFAWINHEPALLYHKKQGVVVCQVFHLDDTASRVVSISTIVDPEKLKNIQR